MAEEESETGVPAALALAGRREASLEFEGNEDLPVLGELHALSPIHTAPQSAPVQQQSTSPREVQGYALSTPRPLTGYGLAPDVSHSAGPLERRGSPPNPRRSETPGSPSSSNSALRTRYSGVSGPQRRVTDNLEQMVFEFYMDHAGPWVCRRTIAHMATR